MLKKLLIQKGLLQSHLKEHLKHLTISQKLHQALLKLVHFNWRHY